MKRHFILYLLLLCALPAALSAAKYSDADLKLQEAQKKLGTWQDDNTDKTASAKKSDGAGQSSSQQSDKDSSSTTAPEDSQTDGETDSDKESVKLNNTASAKENGSENSTAKEPVAAASAARERPFEQPEEERVSFFGTLLKTILVLGLLSGGLFYAVRLIARRQGGFEPRGANMTRSLSLLPLGGGKNLQLVEVGEAVLVIGVAENNISLIDKIEDPEEVNRLRLLYDRRPVEARESFWQVLSRQVVENVKHFQSAVDANNRKAAGLNPTSSGRTGSLFGRGKADSAPPVADDDFSRLLQKNRDKLNRLGDEDL